MAISKVLHVRRLAEFEPEIDDWLDEQVTAAQDLFRTEAGLELEVGSDQTVPFAEGVVHVEKCRLNAGGTAQQLTLFNGVVNVPATDIVVFIVRDFSPWIGGGCAWHPPGRPGCMVTAGTVGVANWKLGHEVGHVLGLFHNDLSTMLMFPSADWSELPPFLSAAERDFLLGVGPAPVPPPNASLALSERALNSELRKIEPDYRVVTKHGSKAVRLLRRLYENVREDEYKARSVYALSLVSRDIDDVLTSAAN